MSGPTTAEKRGTREPKGSPERATSGPGTPNPVFRVPGPRLLLIALAVVLIVAGGIWALYGSTWLRVERVTTSGTQVLTPREVEEAAAVPIGSPLVSVDTDAIEARLVRELPRIDTVEVIRSWPHGIGLKVTERKPVLVVEKGGKFIEVDSGGTRFATVDEAPAGVPELLLNAASAPSLRRFDEDRLLLEAVGVTGELPEKIARDARVVEVASYDSITLELSGGRTVFWGSGEDGAVKARVLAALMKATPKAGHFDVSAPTAPAASGS
ncbi:FtsQ-type POTRA domain-containing protein [Streptomyces sp. P9(2023)]|uniref:cell division protein FtsQ/DivIB n=1 Tax=Streptomyces sp. P9(2023) TaxID=3064394 RepID=UPI0028F43334|nr:FtsQ-type POTRA domain-containing protein [Streptomyces sp. P9(2023)]MDT9687924.1 FtsQ-type POTRA domain-containing protein [Streptomyces sp. P9(2023)]